MNGAKIRQFVQTAKQIWLKCVQSDEHILAKSVQSDEHKAGSFTKYY